MGRRCAICVRKDRQKIDSAIASGTPASVVSGSYHLSPDSLQRHRASGHIAGIAKAAKPLPVVSGLPRADVERLTAREIPAAPTPVRAPIEAVKLSLRSPENVLDQLEWAVGETKALLEAAKAAGDLRLQDRLLQTAIGALDKLAKSVGLYSDQPVVMVDASTKNLEVAVAGMSPDELRAFIRAHSPPIEAIEASG